MAILCLGDIDRSAPLLRDWLGGDWGLLFSHPADFQVGGLEYDRWLSILRDDFRARAVRPLACRRPAGDADGSWVAQLQHDQRLIALVASNPGYEDVIDLAARTLREQIVQLSSHFVLIIDPALRSRGLLRYGAGRPSVSPLDLLGSIDALRRRSLRHEAVRTRAGLARAVA
jgi:hypothetical protein